MGGTESVPVLFFAKIFFRRRCLCFSAIGFLGRGKAGKWLQVGRVEEEEYIKVKKNVTFATRDIFFDLFPVIHR